jgi:predicted transcriptional regulator
MRKTATLNLRISSEFKKRLIEEAKREKRSVTNYLEATLSSFWDEKQKTSATDRGGPKKVRRG